jgi:hypothetical protein
MGSYIGDDANGRRNEISQEGKLQGTEGQFQGRVCRQELPVAWHSLRHFLLKGSFEEKPFQGATFMEGNAKGHLSKKVFQNINIPGFLLFVTSNLEGLFRSSVAAVTVSRPFQACSVFCDRFPCLELLIRPVS